MHTSYIAWVHHLKSIPDLMFLLRQYKKKAYCKPSRGVVFFFPVGVLFHGNTDGEQCGIIALNLSCACISRRNRWRKQKHFCVYAVIRSRATVRHTSFDQHAEASSGACTPHLPANPGLFPAGRLWES